MDIPEIDCDALCGSCGRRYGEHSVAEFNPCPTPLGSRKAWIEGSRWVSSRPVPAPSAGVRSGPGRPPRVGDVFSRDKVAERLTIVRIDPARANQIRFVYRPGGVEDGFSMAQWNGGAFTILSDGPAPAKVVPERALAQPWKRMEPGHRWEGRQCNWAHPVAPDVFLYYTDSGDAACDVCAPGRRVFADRAAPAKVETCKAYCGTVDNLGVVLDGTVVIRPFRRDGRAYCTQACADRAAGRAGAKRVGLCRCGEPSAPGVHCFDRPCYQEQPVDPRAARRAEWLRNWTSQSDAGMALSSVTNEPGIVGGSRIERANAHLTPRWRTAPYVSPRRDVVVGCQLDAAEGHEGKDVK